MMRSRLVVGLMGVLGGCVDPSDFIIDPFPSAEVYPEGSLVVALASGGGEQLIQRWDIDLADPQLQRLPAVLVPGDAYFVAAHIDTEVNGVCDPERDPAWTVAWTAYGNVSFTFDPTPGTQEDGFGCLWFDLPEDLIDEGEDG